LRYAVETGKLAVAAAGLYVAKEWCYEAGLFLFCWGVCRGAVSSVLSAGSRQMAGPVPRSEERRAHKSAVLAPAPA